MIAMPPAYEPNAMPALTADAGNDEARGAPGPARLTTRCCIDGAMPMANSPSPRTATAISRALPPKKWIAPSDAVKPKVPTISVREALASANRPPPNDPIVVATPYASRKALTPAAGTPVTRVRNGTR